MKGNARNWTYTKYALEFQSALSAFSYISFISLLRNKNYTFQFDTQLSIFNYVIKNAFLRWNLFFLTLIQIKLYFRDGCFFMQPYLKRHEKLLSLTVINESLDHCTFVESKESGVPMQSNFVISSLLQHLIILTMFIDRLYWN